MEKLSKVELEKELLAQAPLQWNRFQQRKQKTSRGKQKWQIEIDNIDNRVKDAKRDADNLRRKYMMDPALREIQKKMEQRNKPLNTSKLVCPECKEDDHGNKMNKQAWCMKCNTALVSSNSNKKGRKQPKIRFINKTTSLQNELNRLNPGLNPKNDTDKT